MRKYEVIRPPKRSFAEFMGRYMPSSIIPAKKLEDVAPELLRYLDLKKESIPHDQLVFVAVKINGDGYVHLLGYSPTIDGALYLVTMYVNQAKEKMVRDPRWPSGFGFIGQRECVYVIDTKLYAVLRGQRLKQAKITQLMRKPTELVAASIPYPTSE